MTSDGMRRWRQTTHGVAARARNGTPSRRTGEEDHCFARTRVVTIEAESLQDDHPSRLVSLEALANMRAELAFDSDETLSCAFVESLTISALPELYSERCDQGQHA